jgi:hypothetical protein
LLERRYPIDHLVPCHDSEHTVRLYTSLRVLARRRPELLEPTFLDLPGWADEWYVKEARLRRIDGVVHLVAGESRSSYFVTRALEEAGIPVLEIDANNADARSWDEAAFVAELDRFIEDRLGRRPA